MAVEDPPNTDIDKAKDSDKVEEVLFTTTQICFGSVTSLLRKCSPLDCLSNFDERQKPLQI